MRTHLSECGVGALENGVGAIVIIDLSVRFQHGVPDLCGQTFIADKKDKGRKEFNDCFCLQSPPRMLQFHGFGLATFMRTERESTIAVPWHARRLEAALPRTCDC